MIKVIKDEYGNRRAIITDKDLKQTLCEWVLSSDGCRNLIEASIYNPCINCPYDEDNPKGNIKLYTEQEAFRVLNTFLNRRYKQ